MSLTSELTVSAASFKASNASGNDIVRVRSVRSGPSCTSQPVEESDTGVAAKILELLSKSKVSLAGNFIVLVLGDSPRDNVLISSSLGPQPFSCRITPCNKFDCLLMTVSIAWILSSCSWRNVGTVSASDGSGPCCDGWRMLDAMASFPVSTWPTESKGMILLLGAILSSCTFAKAAASFSCVSTDSGA